MAAYADIKRRMGQLEDVGFYSLVEMICDLEADTEKLTEEKDRLEAENEKLEAKLAEFEGEE